MINWLKKNYLVALIILVILMLVPTLLRGFKIDLSLIFSGAIQAGINAVTAYYVLKHLDKEHDKNIGGKK